MLVLCLAQVSGEVLLHCFTEEVNGVGGKLAQFCRDQSLISIFNPQNAG